MLLRGRGDEAEAALLLAEALRECEAAFGSEHPRTRRCADLGGRRRPEPGGDSDAP